MELGGISIKNIKLNTNSSARLIQICKIIAEYFKGSFGPKGLDKLLYDKFDNNILISSDGGTILEDLKEHIELKLAKFILTYGKNIYDRNGDGVKTFYILLSEMLSIFQKLTEQGISRGIILESLDKIKEQWIKFTQHSLLERSREKILKNERFLSSYFISLIYGKFSNSNTKHIADLAVKISCMLGNKPLAAWFDPKTFIQFQFLPGTFITESKILNGCIISKEPVNTTIIPGHSLLKPRILAVKMKLYLDPPDGSESGHQGYEYDIKFKNGQDHNDFTKYMEDRSIKIVNNLLKLKPDLIITHKGINRDIESLLNKNDVLLIRRVKTDEFENLTRVLEIEAIGSINDISDRNLGIAERLTYKKIGREKKITIELPKNKKRAIGTVLIGGSQWIVCKQVKRGLLKLIYAYINLLRMPKILYGGGNTELAFAQYLKKSLSSQNFRIKSNYKIIYCIQEILEGFYIIPSLLMENAGINSKKGLSILISKYINDVRNIGFNVINLQIEDMRHAHVYDNFSAKNHLYLTLFESLKQIVRIDKIINKKSISKKS
ncbi:MAG: hypothetical protein GF364_14230 [Candidatus Lokiarchaeota archaeon]|nr:hypothetical protein [Candidatus Lokiarchaeota archaeon]